MTQERVLEYLTEYGEKINAEIKIPGLTAKRVSGIIAKLMNLKLLERRQTTHNSKIVWCYRVANAGPIEPEYSFILRNLPRHINDGLS